MKLSVAIITYKHGAYVAQALDSVLAQETPFDFEVVVGDDASPDDTQHVLREYAERYPGRLRLMLRDQNVGMHRNLEEVLAACQGDYVALLEGDDYWTRPDKLHRQVEALEADRAATLCFHPVELVYAPGVDASVGPTDEPPEGAGFTELLRANFIHTGSVVFRRDAYAGYPGWMHTLKMADWPLFLLLAERGTLCRLPERMGAYRVHPGGVWSTKPLAFRVDETMRVMDYLEHHFGARHAAALRERRAVLLRQRLTCFELEGNLAGCRRTALRLLMLGWSVAGVSKRELLLMVMEYGLPGGARLLSLGKGVKRRLVPPEPTL